MVFSIVFKRSVEKDLAKLDKVTARRILTKIDAELGAKADIYPTLKGEFSGLRKFRVGDHRIIYAILGDQVMVLRIGNRKEVYR